MTDDQGKALDRICSRLRELIIGFFGIIAATISTLFFGDTIAPCAIPLDERRDSLYSSDLYTCFVNGVGLLIFLVSAHIFLGIYGWLLRSKGKEILKQQCNAPIGGNIIVWEFGILRRSSQFLLVFSAIVSSVVFLAVIDIF